MKVEVLSSALDDLNAAYEFYEQQSVGLGSNFLQALIKDIDSLVLYAGIHQQHLGFYRLLAKRFPYAVYYKVNKNKNTALVFRVLDLRQNPAKTNKFLS